MHLGASLSCLCYLSSLKRTDKCAEEKRKIKSINNYIHSKYKRVHKIDNIKISSTDRLIICNVPSNCMH